MKTEAEITHEFFTLCNDLHPLGARYCYKATIWFGMALQELSENGERREVYSDKASHILLKYMLVRQNADNVFARRTEPMSDMQRKHAALELCRMRAIDPDGLVSHGPAPNSDGTMNLILLRSPAWKLVLQEILAQENIEAAMAAGRAYAL